MPFTPGIASALLASIFFTRACGYGLSSSFANSMPSARKSSAYLDCPVTFATRSGVTYFWPMSLLAISRIPHVLGAFHQRRENLVVVLAPAQIARDAVRQLLARRIRIRFQVPRRG